MHPVQRKFMNRYDRFEQLLKEAQIINEEIRRSWNSESAKIFCSSFEDELQYIKKTAENCCSGDDCSENGRSPLADFSF